MKGTVGFLVVFGSLSWSLSGMDPASSESVLPFEFFEGHMILVEVSAIGETDLLQGIIDTGASHSVVNRKAAQRFRSLQLVDSQKKITAFGDRVKAGRAVVRGLRVGGRTWTIGCLSADLPWKKVDLIIGMDVLGHQSFRIDYENSRIVFSPAFELTRHGTFDLEGGLISLEARVGGRTQHLVADSGAPFATLFQNLCSPALMILPRAEHAGLGHLGGTAEGRPVTLPDIAIGEGNWEQVSALILPGGGGSGSERDGVVGLKSLGFKAVQFDFDCNRMSWED